MQKRDLHFRTQLHALTQKFISDVVDAAMRAPRTSRTLTTLDIAEYGTRIPRYRELRRQTLRRFETDYVTAVLRAASGNISMAARLANIDRKHFWRLLSRTNARFVSK